MCSADVLSENPVCLMPGCGSFPEAWVATSLTGKALGEVKKGSELGSELISELSTCHLGAWLKTMRCSSKTWVCHSSESWCQGHHLCRSLKRPAAGNGVGFPTTQLCIYLTFHLFGNSCHLTSFTTSAQLGTASRVVLEDETALDTPAQKQIFVSLLISKAQLSLYPQSQCAGEKCDQSVLKTTKNDLQELFLALLGHEIMDIKIMTLLYIEKLF